MEAQGLVAQYAANWSVYDACTKKLQTLCVDILSRNGISVHSVTSRTKLKDSLLNKISKPEKEYSSLEDITDLVGLRIITYLASDVVRVGGAIEREFELDQVRSIDKTKADEPDRFGYASVHYVARLSSERRALIEYGEAKDIFFEIQVRSILQHAWAEIEHDLGYKSEIAVPYAIRRRFSRLSSLLELADSEFNGVTEEIRSYRQSVHEQIRTSPPKTNIDKDTLAAFLDESVVSRRIDEGIASAFRASVRSTASVQESDIKRLAHFKIRTIGDLSEALSSHEGKISRFVAIWVERKGKNIPAPATIRRGISIFYLAYVLAAESRSFGHVMSYLLRMDIASSEASRELAVAVLDAYRSAD